MNKKNKTRDQFFKLRLLSDEVVELKHLAQSEELDISKYVRSRIFAQNQQAA